MPKKDNFDISGDLSYLGSLRSEFDDDLVLDSSFEKLLIEFEKVRLAYINHKLNDIDAANLFKKLSITASDGSEWTLGASTKRWFRRFSGSMWEYSPAPNGVAVDSSSLASWVYSGIDNELNVLMSKVDTSTLSENKHVADIVIEKIDIEKKDSSKSLIDNYTILSSTSSNVDLDWLEEEMTLSGQESLTQLSSKPVDEDLIKIADSSISDSVGQEDISDLSSSHSSPEDFFLKDE